MKMRQCRLEKKGEFHATDYYRAHTGRTAKDAHRITHTIVVTTLFPRQGCYTIVKFPRSFFSLSFFLSRLSRAFVSRVLNNNTKYPNNIQYLIMLKVHALIFNRM